MQYIPAFFFPVQSSFFLFLKKFNSGNVSLDLHVDGMCNPSAPKAVVTLHRTSEESDMSETALSFWSLFAAEISS